MKDLTVNCPKPLLLYNNKPLLEHTFDALPDTVSEVVIVVGYLGDKIKNHFNNSWNGKRVRFVEQVEKLGTAHALFEARAYLDEPFLVLMGDDLYSKTDLTALTSQKNWAILVEESLQRQSGGKIIIDQMGNLKGITEDKEGLLDSNLTYTGACFLTPDIFNYPMVQLPNSLEFGLPQTFSSVAAKHPIKIHYSTFWKRITSPEDLT